MKKITEILKIKYPIIQAGMIWTSGSKLAAAASNAGCLGVIGGGSMKPPLLKTHLEKMKTLTSNPYAVNFPLLYKDIEEQIEVSLEMGVKIFITGAGSPKKFTKFLKDKGCTVIHVVSTPELATKCEDAGVDMVIAEGFEAGGHNGRDELTTMTLIPQVTKAVKIPVIAAGGISSGRAMASAMILGASGVQMGTRFLMTKESSAHPDLKKHYLNAKSTDTALVLKELVPVRLLKNKFYEDIKKSEENNATKEELHTLLGKGRAKKGILEGDLSEGELEIGQIISFIKDIPSVEELVKNIIDEYNDVIKALTPL